MIRYIRAGTAALGGVMVIAACTSNGPDETHCNVSGNACTWLGVPGQVGFTPDGQSPLNTEVYWTLNVMFASDGTPWFIDWNNHLVRKIVDGKVVSVVGWDDPVFPGDGDPTNPSLEHTAAGDLGTNVQLNHPTQLWEMPDHTITVVAWHNHKLRSVDPSTGNVRILAGVGGGFKGDGGPYTAALFNRPSQMTMDEAGDIYLVDQANQRVRMIDGSGDINTIVGAGSAGFAGDGGPCDQALLSFDTGDNPEPSGGITYANGVLYISDTQNNRIRKVDLTTDVITTIAGTGSAGYSGDGGDATAAQLYNPHAIKIGPDGNLYIADTNNGVIRSIDLTTNVITTVAGTGTLGLDPDDDKPATELKLDRPFGVDFDPAGNLYISDTLNSRILRVAK